MGVRVAGPEAGNPGTDGDPFAGVPVPGYRRHFDRRGALDGCAACPSALRQVLGEVDLRKTFGKPQPSVVGNDADLAPSDIEKRLNPLCQQVNLLVDPSSQLCLQRMAKLVELPVLGPGPTRGIARLVRCEVLKAAISEESSETVRGQWAGRLPPGACHAGRGRGDCRLSPLSLRERGRG